MLVGILLQSVTGRNMVSRLVLAFGLFGFAGGITNWLAVKMLFDKVPGLMGSGIIPRQFKEIREAIKESVMEMFFDRVFLEQYLHTRSKELLHSLDLPQELRTIMSAPSFDAMFVEKLVAISQKPEGMMLATMASMFGGVAPMASMIKPMLVTLGQEMMSSFVDSFDPKRIIDVDKLRNELDVLMTEKLLQLTPERVKQILEHVIREHLGWIVVWGNIFGGLIGVLSVIVGYQG